MLSLSVANSLVEGPVTFKIRYCTDNDGNGNCAISKSTFFMKDEDSGLDVFTLTLACPPLAIAFGAFETGLSYVQE